MALLVGERGHYELARGVIHTLPMAMTAMTDAGPHAGAGLG